VLVAAVSTRDDAAVFAGVIVAFLAFASADTPRRRERLATQRQLSAHTVFRLAYYGALAPNTYYLKMSGHLLSERLARGIDTYSHLVACTLWAPIGLALALLVVRRASLTRSGALLVALVGVGMAYSVYVGGDAWEWAHFANRYVSTVLPLLLVLALLGVEALRSARGPAAAWGLGVAGLFVGGFSLFRLRSYGDGAAVAEVLATALAFTALWLGRHGRIARSPAARAAIGMLPVLVLVGLVNGRPLEAWRGGGATSGRQNKVQQAFTIRTATPPDLDRGGVGRTVLRRIVRRSARQNDRWSRTDALRLLARPTSGWLQLGQLQPDLVVELWKDTPRDRQQMRTWGYERLGTYWLRGDLQIDRSKLAPDR
jgi:hypothetical protein